jgi:hypothetical protein
MLFDEISNNHVQILSCFRLKANVVYNLTIFLNFLISFPNLLHNFSTMKCKYLLMCVHTSHQPYGYALFMLFSCQRTHMNPWCNLWYLCCHYMKCWFHVGQEQLHVFLSNMFNPFCWQVNIVFTKDGIHTLANVVIIDLMWVDLFPQFCATQRFVASNVVQTKKRTIVNDTPLINSSL